MYLSSHCYDSCKLTTIHFKFMTAKHKHIYLLQKYTSLNFREGRTFFTLWLGKDSHDYTLFNKIVCRFWNPRQEQVKWYLCIQNCRKYTSTKQFYEFLEHCYCTFLFKTCYLRINNIYNQFCKENTYLNGQDVLLKTLFYPNIDYIIKYMYEVFTVYELFDCN